MIPQMKELARRIRKALLISIYNAGSGHPGGSLSATDIMTVLFFYTMKTNPENVRDPERDYFILSKGHVCPALYAVLAARGFIPPEELLSLRKMGTRLQGHPHWKKLECLELSCGSLGQGLSVANGIAIGLKMDKKPNRVYCMTGDGELQEGQMWEAIMTASHYHLDNLCAIVDYNNLQIDGYVEDVMSIAPLDEKFRAFNWNVIEADGHDIEDLMDVFDRARVFKGRPTVLLCSTIKGKGVSYMENEAGWHGKAPSKELTIQALNELDALEIR
ncbi:MAG: transketolase [Candidatus Eremiobacteraeota bacterium]|nr:transketolase [Candidatus Eremiobacteraeota bacterium]